MICAVVSSIVMLSLREVVSCVGVSEVPDGTQDSGECAGHLFLMFQARNPKPRVRSNARYAWDYTMTE